MDETRHPWWMVTAVFDPDGGGSDFAYTEGLAREGRPELHIWGRPSLGDDPGEDWCFSQRDACRILNQAAWRLLDGELAAGDSWEASYDEGFVTARFTVGEPVAADAVDAWGADDAPVLPIAWELVRPPLGPPRPLSREAQKQAVEEYDDIVAGLVPAIVVPPGWELPRAPSWDPGQVYGPRTPLVLARAAQIWQAGSEALESILDRALVVAGHVGVGYAAAVARAAGREPGRVPALDRLERAVESVLGPADASPEHALLVGAVTTALVVEATADLLPDRVVTLGQGVVRTALTWRPLAPDGRWACSDAVAQAVVTLLSSTSGDDLLDAARTWSTHDEGESRWPVLATLWTSAAFGPEVAVQDATSPSRRGRVPSPEVRVRALQASALIQDWVNDLATLLCHRPVFHPRVVDTFLECSRRVPGLAALLDQPLTHGGGT
ncbi:hypothetical protein [Nocardioides dongkuii]|uniref:hypothetical protein n=1 Tax=Nocardioides dongkuii TaxID=2760089 RepID=UPI0015FA4E3E|nr:hypothetical protein [Nocardioides dongkuii]